MQQLRMFLDTLHPLTEAEFAAFAGSMERREVARKDFLLREGQVCHHIGFIQEGSFRFYFTKDGTEMITAFFSAGDFLSNYRSFLTRQPSTHSIEALSDAVVWTVHRDRILALYDAHPGLERLGRRVAEQLYLSVAQRLDSFQYETPEERYLGLLRKGSTLMREIPQYMLASYLGVSAESLSRIRKRITP